jgi:carbon-monoxide dehydrogenase large subunit
MGIDRVEIRRRNMIPKEAYPYSDAGAGAVRFRRSHGCLDGALVAADVKNFGCARRPPPAMAKFRGLGFSTYVEGLRPRAVAISPDDWARAAAFMRAPRCACIPPAR